LAQFKGPADFKAAQFKNTATFIDAHFLDANFDYAEFEGESLFDGTWFNGTLSLQRTKYDNLNMRLSHVHDLAYDDTAYFLLIENFKKLGFTDDANKCYYSYRCKHGWELWRRREYLTWFLDSLAWWSYGYGLQPWQPLGWSALLILMAGVFFWRSSTIKKKDDQSKGVSFLEALLLGATYYTSGASNIISSRPKEFAPQASARYVIVLLRLLGWIFFILFLATLGRTV